ncbi:MAG: hypothetical protein IJ160_07870 [Muribaculaceae bacterium]|nr:hypothetical protein [Muribaculaceae bacterium]
MKIITDNATLLRLLPNVVTSVEGETPLYDKVHPWLVIAEQWVSDRFTGAAVLDAVAADPDTTIWQQTAILIMSEAMRQAIPSLDVVLTPNGFGIVSNQNVAPASKERVARLIESMTAGRDLNIDYLLDSLSEREDWLQTKQRDWWCQTLLQSPRDAELGVYGPEWTGNRWEAFIELRERARNIEVAIAERWVSEALMNRLRQALRQPGAPTNDVVLARRVLDCVYTELKGEPRHCHALERIVNYVRQQPEEYPEWASSDTARLFDPPVFRNEKNSKGYFF